MGTIPDYPLPSRPLDASDRIAGWMDGRQVSIPADVALAPALETALVGLSGDAVETASAAALAAHADRLLSDANAAAAAGAATTATASAAATNNAYQIQKLRQRIRTLEGQALPYLPALTTSAATYYEVSSTERLVAGSTMPLLQAIKPSDSSTVDMGGGAVRVRPFEIKNLRGTALNVKAAKYYDQSGNGRDQTQTTAANRPVLHEDGTINGLLAMTFPGVESGVGRTSHFISPTISLDRQNFTMFLVMDPTASYKNQDYLRMESGTSTLLMSMAHLSSGASTVDNGHLFFNTGTVQQTHKYLQASPHILTIVGTSGVLNFWLDDINVTGTNAAATIVKLFLGCDPTSGFFANWRCAARVVSDKGLNATDLAAIWAVLRTRFRLSTNYDATLVVAGTSRTVAGQADNALTALTYEQKYLSANLRVYNMGQDGQALSTTLTNFAAREATTYDATRPWILRLDDWINDLGGLGASHDPTTIYNTTAGGLLTAARALGTNVIVGICTCLPQDSSGVYTTRSSAQIETDRQALNALILANSLGFDFVTDVAGVTSMGTYPTNPDDSTKYQTDKLHLTALGNSLIAAKKAASLEALAL
jgi:hypothetical protein